MNKRFVKLFEDYTNHMADEYELENWEDYDEYEDQDLNYGEYELENWDEDLDWDEDLEPGDYDYDEDPDGYYGEEYDADIYRRDEEMLDKYYINHDDVESDHVY